MAFSTSGNNLRKPLFHAALALIAAISALYAFAHMVAPDLLLKSVTLEGIAIIRQDEDMPPGNPAKVTDVVEARILPLFDFNHMTRIAMARNWRRATPEQQAMLTADFTTLLVRIYFTALSGQGDPVIEFKRLRTASEDTEVTVISVIKPPEAVPLTMAYDMEKMATGWKV